MATVKMDCSCHGSGRNQAYSKTIFAVQLTWMYMLVVTFLEGSVTANFSLIAQE